MSASQDFVALDWIKADISEILLKAQLSLESVAENGDDPSNMRACLTALHQVHGTLKTVEIKGPILVAAEMEALAQALMNNQVPDVGHAQELLMQTILRMPGYLDRIQRKQQDNPQFVRPTVNNLRISRGVEKLEAGDDLSLAGVFTAAPSDLVIQRYGASDGPATIKKLRVRYQQALSALLKKQSPRENLRLIANVLQMQAKLCSDAPSGHYAKAMLAVVEGVANGALKFDGSLAGQLKKYDSILKVLAEGTPDSLGLVISVELVSQLQTILAKATKETPRILAARQLFDAAPAEASLIEDLEFGPDDQAVATVSKILIEALNGVTDKLDLYVRSSARKTSDLVELVPLMEQISSTLLVVSKLEHQRSILRQIEAIGAIESSGEQPGDEQLLDIAGALLEISADLNRLIGHVDERGETDHFGDLDEAQASVIRETRIGLARSKDAIIDYISNSFAKDKLETLAANLCSLGRGLLIINQQRCAVVLAECSRYVDEKLLGRDIQPSLAELEDLADAISSIDYFLERLIESSTEPYWQMVEVAETAIAKLGYSVIEDLSATVISEELAPFRELLVSEDEGAAESILDQLETPEAEEIVFGLNDLEVNVDRPERSADSELDQILLEEAEQNFATLTSVVNASQPWVDPAAIAAYDTLKGSSGMAEAPAISVIAAPMEMLLAGMRGRSQPMNGEVRQLMVESLELMQQVTSNLAQNRIEFEPGEGFANKVGSSVATSEPAPVFGFHIVRHLSQAEAVLRDWSVGGLKELQIELLQVIEQAKSLGHESIVELCQTLEETHRKLQGRPDSETIDRLLASYDALVHMFDQLASSHEIVSATTQIARLVGIDFSRLEAGQRNSKLANEITEALKEFDKRLAEFQSSTPNESPNLVRAELGRLLEHPAIQPEISITLELMLGLVEVIATSEDDLVEKLAACRAGLSTQLQELSEGSQVALKSELVTSCKNALAARRESAASYDTGSEQEQGQESTAGGVLPADQVDDNVLTLFLEEAEELAEALDECILTWRGDTNNSAHLDLMLRHLHTLKGGARLAGLNSLGEFTHNFETFLIGVQQSPIQWDDDFFAALNVQQDEVTRRVEVYTKMAQSNVSDTELAFLNDAPAAVVTSEAAQAGTATQVAAPFVAQDIVDEPPVSAVSNQKMIRVSAQLLESLISLAGESNITRGRVEQQIRGFGESLQEMEETTNRVREQIRRLEIEAESRETVVRQAREEQESESGFDDLEMDRYTMLQEISRSLNESFSNMLDLKEMLTNKSRDAEALLHQQVRIGTELQEGLTRTRMVPFSRLIPRLRRIVMQTSAEVGKSVRFDAFNVEGELDRRVLERIVAPLEHMLRNAVDHGIESADKRRSSNKPETGRISLRLSREGGYVVLTIGDDGGGINVGAVRKKAIERGVMTKESTLSDHDIMQFIMHAGFSTAEKLTQISGRGVGMDVVNSEIKNLGGSISIDSQLGVSTEFKIHIPFTVSINRALLVVVREEVYAVPLNTIEGIVRVSPYELEAYYQPDAPMFEYAGQPYCLAYMGKMLERGDNPVLEGLVGPLPVILVRSGENSVALQVDRVIGSREIVSKSLGRQFSNVAGVSGAAVMADGSVVVILDVLAFIRKSEAVTSSTQGPDCR